MSDKNNDTILSGHTNDINSCDFSVNGLLVTSSSDKTVRVWARPSPDEPPAEVAYSPLTCHTYSVHCVRFSPSGASFLSCSTDGTAVLWNTKTGVTRATLRHSSQCPLRACCFSADGNLLATAGDDGYVCIWSADDTPAMLLCLQGHEETVSCLSFSTDGGLLVSGCLQGDLRLWQPRAGQTAPIGGHANAHDLGVTSCDFMPRNPGGSTNVLASCGNDCAVRLWIVQPSGETAPLACLTGHSGAVMAVRFSADSSVLASAAGDKTVRLWSTSTWTLKDVMHGHVRYVTCCCFSADGRYLVSGSNDKTARLRLVAGALPPAAGIAPLPQSAPQDGVWTCQEVGEWLRSLGLAQYAAGFAERGVDGAALLQLTEQQLETELAVELVGHRNKLVRQLDRLKRDPQRSSTGSPPPDEFYCPITRELMTEPVVCSDGYSYQLSAITAWLSERNSSPMTNEALTTSQPLPNHALRSLIRQWRLRHPQ